MKYALFIQLYSEAMEYNNLDAYIAERGWQSWMDAIEDPNKIVFILTSIYNFAKSSLQEIRESYHLSRAAFCRLFNIPIRTVEDWEARRNKMPIYTKLLICYVLITEFMPEGEDEIERKNRIE